jgi:putative transposase
MRLTQSGVEVGSAEASADGRIPLRSLVGNGRLADARWWSIMGGMSRLRRLVVSDRWFFVTCRVLPGRQHLIDSEFACLAHVIRERREEHGFLLTAWVFLPDHWHAILYPAHPLTISRVVESLKDAATKRINRSRRKVGRLFQPRFFDRALRTVKEYKERVQYIHLNPVKAGLVSRPEDWPWSSVHDYVGSVNRAPIPPSGLSIDRVLLPADERTRI